MMHEDTLRTDVLVVGGGLAGCTLGYLLRRGGRDVLVAELLDARTKDKLCAGLVIPLAARLVNDIYGADFMASLTPFLSSGRTLQTDHGSTTAPYQLAALPRKQLDDFCLNRYLEAGGQLVDRVSLSAVDEEARIATFRNLRSGGRLEVAYRELVGADGATSAVRRILVGRNQDICPALEGVVPQVRDDTVFEYSVSPLGYRWYIPQGGRASVGCMYFAAKAPACRERVEEFCARLGVEVPLLRGAAIPTGSEVLLRAGEAWLVGDAAGLINPAEGAGIHTALISAKALAEALLGGTPYEQTMGPATRQTEREYLNVALTYTLQYMSIME